MFAPGANGNAAPVRSIVGAATGLAGPAGLALDAAGFIYVSNRTGNSVEIFAPDADGNVAALRTIVGAATGLSSPYGLTVDSSGRI